MNKEIFNIFYRLIFSNEKEIHIEFKNKKQAETFTKQFKNLIQGINKWLP